MANVTYTKTKTEPSGRKLIFRKQQDGSIISDPIVLGFNVLLNQLAQKPIAQVQFTFKMLFPAFYAFENYGASFVKDYKKVSADFSTGDVAFRIKILNPDVTLDTEVIFKVTIKDVQENDPFPLGGSFGFYSWEPIPPPMGTLLNTTPNKII
jgi:hypothetical protein